MAAFNNPTDLARETLKLLAVRRVAPTPENFTRYYHEIAGTAPGGEGIDAGLSTALRQAAEANPGLTVLARLARALDERETAQFVAGLIALSRAREDAGRPDWPAVLRGVLRHFEMRQTAVSLNRKREGLERALAAYGHDPQLCAKLQALLRVWEATTEQPGAPIEVRGDGESGPPTLPPYGGAAPLTADVTRAGAGSLAEAVSQLRDLLAQALDLGLAARLERFPDLAEEARRLAALAREGRGADLYAQLAMQLRQLFFRLEVRGESDATLLDALLRLLGLLVNNIGELVEDDQWVHGQLEVIRRVINEPLTTDRISEAERRFKEVIYKQGIIKHSLQEAKTTLKNLIGVFVSRLAEMSESTTEYHDRVETYANRLQAADDIATLKTLVDELVGDTRSMQLDMRRYQDDMSEAKRQAEQAELRMRKLEAELEQVSEQVSQDQLTGALNRRGLEEAMQREVARAERRRSPLCVAVLDLDNFKRLNDTYGHQAGDDALVHLIRVVKHTLRPTDIVARYGGEEFIILFSETGIDQAVDVMKRLQRELTRKFFLHNNERLLITFSAGVAAFRPGETQELVFARADKAMYQAKLQGKNRVVSAED